MEYGKKIRLGGFNCLKYKKGDMSFIKVSTIMGNWSMEWREDTIMYRTLDSDLSEDDVKSINVVIVNAFMVGNFVEADFQHAVMVAADEFSKRMNSDAEQISEEEDQEIITNLKAEHEALEELMSSEEKEQ